MHELLDSTLVMLSRKIGDGVEVVKDYDRIAAAGPGLRRRAQPGVDEPHRQRAAGDGRARHADHPHQPRRRRRASSRSATPARAFPTTIVGRIFEPFFTTKPVGEGTGLGLDISWRIVVNKHHGDLSVESQPGDTRFRVRLPLRAPEDDPDMAETSRHRPDRCRRAAPAASSATPRTAGGCTCAAARSAGTSAAATPRPRSTRARTRRTPGIRSCRASSRARTGSGTTRASDYYDGPPLADPQHHPLGPDRPRPADRVPADWRTQGALSA